MPGTKRTASGVLGGFLGLIGLSAVAGLLITATVTPAIAVSGIAAKSSITMFDNLPSALEIDQVMMPTTLYAKNSDTGNYEVLTSFYEQNRSPVQLNQIAPVMIDALLSSEDDRFFTHGGLDLKGTTRAMLGVITKKSTTGGSSITQQYVKNVQTQQCEYKTNNEADALACWEKYTQTRGDDGSLDDGIKRKLEELRLAIAVEQKYSKEDILLGYLNIAAFGGVNYGVDAAARYYFNVPAANLSLVQAATLAGMVQTPSQFRIDQPNNEANGAANGYALTLERRDSVLGRMKTTGKITAEEYEAALAQPIEPHITERPTGCAAATATIIGAEYYCQFVVEILKSDPVFGETAEERQRALNRDGLSIYTTLDTKLQAEATAAMRERVPSKHENVELGSSSVNIDAKTGRVLAIAQNTKFSENQEVINTDPRSYSSQVFASDPKYGDSSIGFEVGSTFKLFTLIDWLEKGHSLQERVNGVDRKGMTGTVCGDQTWFWESRVGNFGDGGNSGGYSGTPMRFTRDSLNSGYAAMASKLQLCDIADVAKRMGAYTSDYKRDANGNYLRDDNGNLIGPEVLDINMDVPFKILGPANVSPISMASAYATVANKGTYCTPHAIDRVVDAKGNERKIPESGCKAGAISESVAATAAYALQGVMASGGTGSRANAYDGTPVFGKTGSHEEWQTWMIQSSTNVTTAVWVGTIKDQGNIWRNWVDYGRINDVRYGLSATIQHAANEIYGGDQLPDPDSNLNRIIYVDLPNVVGKTVDQATSILTEAGFSVTVAPAANGSEPEGTVMSQDPGAGRVNATDVTITPSNGKGSAVPNTKGKTVQEAAAALADAGFSYTSTCTESKSAPKDGIVTGTDPAAGTVAPANTQVNIKFSSTKCKG